MRNFTSHSTKINDIEAEFVAVSNQIYAGKDFYLVGKKEENERFLKLIWQFVGREKFSTTDQLDDRVVVICNYRNRMNYEKCKKEFESKGYEEGINFFQGEVFAPVYVLATAGKLVIDRIEIFLTSYCTLNCEKCIAYIPYFKKHENTSLKMLKDDADLIFKKIDFVDKLKLLGGEGFAYPFLKEYILYLHENYGEQIGTVRIGTNGTIFPRQDVLDVIRECGVIIDISDYSLGVSDLCKMDEVIALFEKNNIRYEVKRSGEQWLDMGFPDNIPEPLPDIEIEERFHKCAMFCRNFYDGKYWFCCSNFAAVRAKLFPEDENDYLDFKETIEKKDILMYELGYSKLGHTTFCRVCRGCSEEVNPMTVPVAKQKERD